MQSKTINTKVKLIKNNWCKNDFYRIFYNILNAAIPAFERYVIKTMREIKNDPKLKNKKRLQNLINIFIQQEIEHTKAHIKINKIIALDKIKTGYFTEKINRWIQKKTPTYSSVASSAFIEFVGFGFFKSHIDKDILYDSNIHKEITKLWKWHIAEELEHSFVKLKIINYINNSYSIKLMGMLEALLIANLFVTCIIPEIIYFDSKNNNKKFFQQLKIFLYGIKNTNWGINKISIYKYFNKNFNPEIKEAYIANIIEKLINETKAK
jgi:hypothetical protein